MCAVKCSVKDAMTSDYPTPSTCHAQVGKVEVNDFEKYVDVYFDILASTDDDNTGKTVKHRLYQEFNGGHNKGYDRALMNISNATGYTTPSFFEELLAKKQDAMLEPEEWLGRQLIIVLEPQKSNPQFVRVTRFYHVDAKEASGCPKDTEFMQALKDCEKNGTPLPLVREDDFQ